MSALSCISAVPSGRENLVHFVGNGNQGIYFNLNNLIFQGVFSSPIFSPMRTLGFSSRLIEGKPRVSLQVCLLSKPVCSVLCWARGVVRMAPGAGF